MSPLPFASLLAIAAASCLTAAVWQPDVGEGTYKNPVLFADYSDPDVVRVGDDYWLTASSFSHVPGLPILHSRDLVNWSLVGHALPTLSYIAGDPDHFAVPRHGAGVWAPAIRFHAGKFWIFFPDPDFGIYVVTARDPQGPWSAPVLVKGGKGLIDPCPLWDADGKVYLIHGWAKSRSGKNNIVTLNELSADAIRVTDGEGTIILDENNSSRGFHTLEGPKFYRRDDTYWIFAPVDGVTTGTQAVYRSKAIRGPYEARVVLGQGSTAINGPHQGGWVDTPDGEHWFMHFQDRGPFGRVVHLEPLVWRADGWPAMGTAVASGAEKGEPVLTHTKPKITFSGDAAPPPRFVTPATSDEFDVPTLGLQWQWQANPRTEFFSLIAQPGSLRLACIAAPSASSLYDAPNLLLQKFSAPAFTATTVLEFSGASRPGDEAGLIVFGYSYAWIGLRRDATGTRLVQVTNIDANKPSAEHESASVEAPGGKVFLRVTVTDEAKCRFAYSGDGIAFRPLGEELQATVGRWVGAKVGLFAIHANTGAPSAATAENGHGDFDWFRFTP